MNTQSSVATTAGRRAIRLFCECHSGIICPSWPPSQAQLISFHSVSGFRGRTAQERYFMVLTSLYAGIDKSVLSRKKSDHIVITKLAHLLSGISDWSTIQPHKDKGIFLGLLNTQLPNISCDLKRLLLNANVFYPIAL